MRSDEMVERIIGAVAGSSGQERVLREALYSLVSLAKVEQILVDDEMQLQTPGEGGKRARVEDLRSQRLH